MSQAVPPEPTQPDPLRARLESWLNQHHQTLLEEVMAVWQEGLLRFAPDAALLADLREQAAPAAPAPDLLGAVAPLATEDRAFAAALDLVEGATSQSELLRKMMEALEPLAERSALFILKQGLATLFAQRGFDHDAPGKGGAVVPPPDLEALSQGLTRAIQKKGPAYTALLAPLSAFEAAECAIFPLRHRRKTVGLLLVDSGLRQRLDRGTEVRALVLAASAMLAALATGKDEEARPAAAPAPAPTPSAPTQRIPEPIDPPLPATLDPKSRAAAERLARVLVGDVELYFPAKVAQARSQGNLYGLLREELDRSRQTFVDRFGADTEREHRIFTTTLIQLLCDGDAAKLGAAPWA